MNILTLRQLVRFELRQNFESVSSEIISLSLQQSSRKTFRTISVKPTQSSTECRRWNSQSCAFSNDITPRRLSLVDCLVEEIIEQQVLQFIVLYPLDCGVGGGTLVGFGDVSEEDGADDTASTPHESDARVVEFPAVVVGGGTHEHETLGVGDEFGSVQCLL
jgi:hypothetical protein